ncbi:branched-chain amino acid ABC transporter substrate-binding protein [Dactylosporangium sp. NPDC051541]|uniref:branched-chain amino acid ABC transporter substrate-binding protein n=1 Tax=Dactylosporangium sp. NPDC051541 TaxID=3363977 RepID=UPI003799CDE6
MELPDGRLPESFGKQPFPEPKPFEIPAPAAPPTAEPPAEPVPEPAADPAMKPARKKAPAKPAPEKLPAKPAPEKAPAKPGPRGPIRPPAKPVPKPPAKRVPKPAAKPVRPPARREADSRTTSIGFAVALVLAVICSVASYFTRQERENGETDTAVPPSRAAELAAGAGCPALGFIGANVLGKDGSDAVRAVRMAVEEHNSRTNSSCKVRLIEADAGHGSQAELRAAVAKFTSDDIVGVVGPLRSADVALAGYDLDSAGLPFVTPSAGDPAVSTRNLKTFHRLYPSDLDVTDAAARLLGTRLNARRVLIVRHAAEGELKMAERMRASGEVSVVATVSIDVGTTDFGAVAREAEELDVDSVFFTGYATEAADLAKALRQAGFTGPLVGGDALLDEDYAVPVGAAGDNTFALCGCGEPRDAVFAKAFLAKHQESPGRYAAGAYDAANLLLGIIGQRVMTRGGVQESLHHGPFTLTQGQFAFTATGDLEPASVSVNVYRPGTGSIGKPAMLPLTAIRLV